MAQLLLLIFSILQIIRNTIACDFNSILKIGIPNKCDLTPIKIFTEEEDANWLEKVLTAVTGAIPSKGLLPKAIEMIQKHIKPNEQYIFQEEINAKLRTIPQCIENKIDEHYIQTKLQDVNVFAALTSCNKKYTWSEKEDCLDGAWGDPDGAIEGFTHKIQKHFGNIRMAESAEDYNRKLILYNAMFEGFIRFAPAYIAAMYQHITTTTNPQSRQEECGELYTHIESSRMMSDTFKKWIENAINTLGESYQPQDLSTGICPKNNPDGYDMLNKIPRVAYRIERRETWSWPIEGDATKEYYTVQIPYAVTGHGITHQTSQFNEKADSFSSQFSVNIQIHSQNARCDVDVQCSSAVDKRYVRQYEWYEYYQYFPDMTSCCNEIRNKRQQGIISLKNQLNDWKQREKKYYLDKLTKLETILAAYPKQETTPPQCYQLYFYPASVSTCSACSRHRNCKTGICVDGICRDTKMAGESCSCNGECEGFMTCNDKSICSDPISQQGIGSLNSVVLAVYCDNSCDVYRSDSIIDPFNYKTEIASTSNWQRPLIVTVPEVTTATSIFLIAQDAGAVGGIMGCMYLHGVPYCTQQSSENYCNDWWPYELQSDSSWKLTTDVVFTDYGDGPWGNSMQITPYIPESSAEWLWNKQIGNQMMFWFRFDFHAVSDQAVLTVQCDNVGTIWYNNDDGKGWIKDISGNNWQLPIKTIINVNPKTNIKVDCQDNGGVGGFIADLYYFGKHYYTTNPITSSKWKIISASSGSTTSLVYTKKGQGAWGNYVDDTFGNKAYWIWNGEIDNKMTFGVLISDI